MEEVSENLKIFSPAARYNELKEQKSLFKNVCQKNCRPLGRRKILGGKKVYIEKNVKTALVSMYY